MNALKLATVFLCFSVTVVVIANETPVAENKLIYTKTLKKFDAKYNSTEIIKACAIEKNITIAEAESDFNTTDTSAKMEPKCMATCVYKKMNMIVNGNYSFEQLKNVNQEGDDEKLFYKHFFEICPQRAEYNVIGDECLLGELLMYCIEDVHHYIKVVHKENDFKKRLGLL